MQDVLGIRASPVTLGYQVSRATRVRAVRAVIRGSQVTQVNQDIVELQVIQEILAIPEHLGSAPQLHMY